MFQRVRLFNVGNRRCSMQCSDLVTPNYSTIQIYGNSLVFMFFVMRIAVANQGDEDYVYIFRMDAKKDVAKFSDLKREVAVQKSDPVLLYFKKIGV